MARAETARGVALDALAAFDGDGFFSAAKLSAASARAGLDRRDAAFASFLVGGVLQNAALLDYNIAKFSKIPLKKLERRVLCILRLGAFQLFFAGGVPARAAVGETVALCGANRRAAGFCNAVLRALSRVSDPRKVDIPDAAARLAVLYSHPEWIVREAIERLGTDGAEALLAADNETPPVTLQINPLRATRDAALETLAAEGESAAPHPFLDGALTLASAAGLASSGFMASGGGWVQDAASFLAVRALAPQPDDRVLDLCAAPGGKTFAASAITGGKCRVTACDISERKLALAAEGAKRLGFDNVQTLAADATEVRPEFVGSFDRIICDLPCSGLGIIRKKPDIRYKPRSSVQELPELQSRILDVAAQYLRPGGTMLYSTCTWRAEENGETVRKFLSTHCGFSPEKFSIDAPNVKNPCEMLTLMPHVNETDGFFICLLRKNNV